MSVLIGARKNPPKRKIRRKPPVIYYNRRNDKTFCLLVDGSWMDITKRT